MQFKGKRHHTTHAIGGDEGRISKTLLVGNLGFAWGCVVNTNLRPLCLLEVALLSIVEFIYVSRCEQVAKSNLIVSLLPNLSVKKFLYKNLKEIELKLDRISINFSVKKSYYYIVPPSIRPSVSPQWTTRLPMDILGQWTNLKIFENLSKKFKFH